MPSNAGYPAFFVGQRLTATLLQSAQPFQAWKAASTSRNTTITRAADPDLLLAAEANSLYELNFFLNVTCTSAVPGFNFTFTVPASATGNYGYSAGGGSGDIHSAFAYGGGGGPATVNGIVSVMGRGVVDTAGTAGNVTLLWAQLASNAINVTLDAGSWMELKRME